MLEITIKDKEYFDSNTEMFYYRKGGKLQLEHSLLSIKKWEEKWHIPFLGKQEKTVEQIKDYIRCMTLNHGVNPDIYDSISPEEMQVIIDYINNPMTATVIKQTDGSNGGANKRARTITAELIYYWMIALQIPFECQKWHLNQLMTLIRVTNIENSPKKKMSKREAARERNRLNEMRRAKYNTKG